MINRGSADVCESFLKRQYVMLMDELEQIIKIGRRNLGVYHKRDSCSRCHQPFPSSTNKEHIQFVYKRV